ncbi:MAG: hypothetical protein WDA03_11495, partial [Trueperaceae bacterium]
VASDLGVVTKSGSWFSFGDVRLGQGKERAAEFVGADVGLRDEIRRLVLEQLGAGSTPTPKQQPEELDDLAVLEA